jgi:hypothetical protein
VLVAHDASGPPGIDWALDNPGRVSALVLLNTYYGWMPTPRPPEAILLYSVPVLRNLARWVDVRSDALDRWLYAWQVGRFITDPSDRRKVVAELYEQFRDERPAFFSLNADLLRTTVSRRRRFPEMRSFKRPVRIIFGAADPYLNAGVAKRFHRLFPTSELHLLPNARHYVQIDAPAEVARLIPVSTGASLSRARGTPEVLGSPKQAGPAPLPTGSGVLVMLAPPEVRRSLRPPIRGVLPPFLSAERREIEEVEIDSGPIHAASGREGEPFPFVDADAEAGSGRGGSGTARVPARVTVSVARHPTANAHADAVSPHRGHGAISHQLSGSIWWTQRESRTVRGSRGARPAWRRGSTLCKRRSTVLSSMRTTSLGSSISDPF